MITSEKIFTTFQVELPVVPVTGQYAVSIEVAFRERITLVGAAVVTSIDRVAASE